MAVPASLRFEPVGCVVSIVGDPGTEPVVLELDSDSAEVLVRTDTSNHHFRDIHGSAVLVGYPRSAADPAEAAAVVDLPSGRVRVGGTVAFRHGQNAVTIRLTSDDGAVELRASFRPVEQAQPAPVVRRHLREV